MTHVKRWYCVQTKIGQEVRASVGVAAQGFPVFVPLRTEFKREGRRLIPTAHPLFERYIFVVIDTNTQRHGSINNTRGVARLLCSPDGKPEPIPNRVMRAIRYRHKTREQKPKRVKAMFGVGDEVSLEVAHNAVFGGMVLGYAGGRVKLLCGVHLVTASEDDLTLVKKAGVRFNRRAA